MVALGMGDVPAKASSRIVHLPSTPASVAVPVSTLSHVRPALVDLGTLPALGHFCLLPTFFIWAQQREHSRSIFRGPAPRLLGLVYSSSCRRQSLPVAIQVTGEGGDAWGPIEANQ